MDRARASVLLIGHSHVAAIDEAWRAREAQGAAPFALRTVSFVGRLRDHLVREAGVARLAGEVAALIGEAVAASRPALVAAAFWGSQHFVITAARHERPFDVLPPGETAPPDPEAELVPFDFVERFLRREFADAPLMIEAVRAATPAPILLLPAPPPMRDFVDLPLRTSDRTLNAEIERHGAAPPALRRKVFAICEAIYRDIAAQAGAPLAWPEAADAQGFRRPEFFGRDWLHANAHWGALALAQIEAACAQRPR